MPGATSQFGYIPSYTSVNAGGLSSSGYTTGHNSVAVKAGATTLTAAEMVGGIVLMDPDGGAANLTTPSAAALIAGMSNGSNDSSFILHVRNTANAAETITVVGGSGVTVSGTATIAQNNAKSFLVLIVEATPGSEAVTMYSMGSAVF